MAIMALVISGLKVSQDIKDELKVKVEELKDKGKSVTLVVIQVGNNSSSAIYVRNKKRACEYIGINSLVFELPEETDQEELLGLIDILNKNSSIDGILIF